ncbi:sigma 54-interacting transcriptional regulator [Anaerovorax odorimutans]|nr:sigma 54-interacting transcriptional regulator [Anaerovorax odorimutans]
MSNFKLTLAECRQILDHISGLVVIDAQGKVRFLSKNMVERVQQLGVSKSEADNYYGKDIQKINPVSKIGNALDKDAKPQIVFYQTVGITGAAVIYPIVEKGELLGAVDYDVLPNDAYIRIFLDMVAERSLNHDLDFEIDIEELFNKVNSGGNVKYRIQDILGESEAIKKLKQRIYICADADTTVLINGETGTGKELAANAIHHISKRANGPMIEINCAAIPENLVESELFGYEEGSFTGAQKGGRPGKFELADKGTIFLDEVDQLPMHIQPKLLRVLQEKEIDRIGGKKIGVDVRVIAATNKNLPELVKDGRFREDLFYRLNVIELRIPPLRERKEDIRLLTEHKIKTIDKDIKGITKGAMKILYNYSWPGNIRELFNVIDRSAYFCSGDRIEEDDIMEMLPQEKRKEYGSREIKSLEAVRDEAEKQAIKRALELYGGNKSKAAQALGVTRSNLYHKMKKNHIE